VVKLVTRRIIHPVLAVYPPAFYLSRPRLHLAHQNTCVNGANFVVNRHNTRKGALDFYYNPFKHEYTALFSVGLSKPNILFMKIFARFVSNF